MRNSVHFLIILCALLSLVVVVSFFYRKVSAGSPLRGRDFAVNVFGINHPSLPTPFFFKKKKNMFLCLFMSLWPF